MIDINKLKVGDLASDWGVCSSNTLAIGRSGASMYIELHRLEVNYIDCDYILSTAGSYSWAYIILNRDIFINI